MKYLASVALILFYMIHHPVFAGEKDLPFADKNELLEHFDDPALVKELFFQAHDVSEWLSSECKKSDEKCEAALRVMNQPFSQWNNLDAKSGFHSVTNCQEQLPVTHPNPALHRILGKPIINTLRDINGKLWILSLCDGVQTNPNGFWTFQFSSWCMSITGITEVWILSCLTQVPGTNFQILTHIPYNPKSMKEISVKVNELNGLVDTWAQEWASLKE